MRPTKNCFDFCGDLVASFSCYLCWFIFHADARDKVFQNDAHRFSPYTLAQMVEYLLSM